MNIQDIINTHPVPWRYQTTIPGPHGNIVIVDAAGQQVQLMTILDFMTLITADIAMQNQARKEPATA